MSKKPFSQRPTHAPPAPEEHHVPEPEPEYQDLYVLVTDGMRLEQMRAQMAEAKKTYPGATIDTKVRIGRLLPNHSVRVAVLRNPRLVKVEGRKGRSTEGDLHYSDEVKVSDHWSALDGGVAVHGSLLRELGKTCSPATAKLKALEEGFLTFGYG